MIETTAQLDTLVELSQLYGANPNFVLAGGGNTSYKTDSTLYVKGSGVSLAKITAKGFVALNREQLSDILKSDLGSDINVREELFKQAILKARLHPEKGQRPSVECILHNLLPARYVIHTHATLVNSLSCNSKSQDIVSELFGNEVLWLPYVDPGYTLAKTLFDAYETYCKRTSQAYPKAIIMENHGLIVCGETAEEIQTTTDRLLAKIENKISSCPTPIWLKETKNLTANETSEILLSFGPALRGALADSTTLPIITFEQSTAATRLACQTTGKQIALGGPLTPDQIVYCKSFPLWISISFPASATDIVNTLQREISEYKKTRHVSPKVVILEGVGIFFVGSDYNEADITRQVYLDAIKVMQGASQVGSIQYLTESQRSFIENWEAENYRKQVSASSHSIGRVSNKVAIVTGAAQGFGLEIAQELCTQGAHVVLCDINIDGAKVAAETLCSEYGALRALPIQMNVTSKDSIHSALAAVTQAYGGFDVFISNAGVLKAESVKTQAEKDFDFVTSVNYKGYFLCTQEASSILALQHYANPSYRSDIIQINSKSGLQGSNKNGAYAGSKFGGIGLTQSFALELVTDGIKVNSICPGNFFDGPLWSDPKKGLFVQYLETGKVPGAKSIEDVKRFYEQKVPMGRGCRTSDVTKAIYYIIEQLYETGQAIPVTGGQVMLN